VAASKLQVGSKVEAVVELVKEAPGYAVMSLPGCKGALAFAATTDYNQQVREGDSEGEEGERELDGCMSEGMAERRFQRNECG
jgi:hypothetical protein